MHCNNDNEEYNTIYNTFIASNKSEIQYLTKNNQYRMYFLHCESNNMYLHMIQLNY
jgi:hypothetical protein